VFYLHGEDEFRKDEAARALVEQHLDPATRDFNLDFLRASQVDGDRLASILATPPMMAEWRVVVLREVEALATSPKARDALLACVQKPPPGLALILLATVPEKSKARFYKDLENGAQSRQFAAVSPNDLPHWVVERAREHANVEVDEDAARALASAVGSDLGVLSQEIEKLATLVGDRGRVTRADVEAAGIRLPRQDRWQWFDMVGERRFQEALTGLEHLLNQNESGVGLAAGLGTHLLRLALGAHGGPAALEASLEPYQKWLAKRLMPQARKWSPDEIDRALLDLLRVDRLLKASGAADEALLEEWLLTRMVVADERASASPSRAAR
jgi:DNA polymerase III subunit delta